MPLRHRSSLRSALTLTLTLATQALTPPPPAHADPLPDNRYAIDLFQGPILAPIRVTGLSGAYAGYSEGIEGFVSNAAAPAVREPFSANFVEFDAAGSLSIPLSLFENNDFDNSGYIDADYGNFVYLTGGGVLQVGIFGAGINAELQRYSISDSGEEASSVTVGKYHALVAVSALSGQLTLGAGTRLVTLGITAPEASLTMFGAAPEIGALIRPDWRSFRLGATFRMPVDAGGLLGTARTRDPQGRERAGGLIVPRSVVLPWELEVGFALQVGPRPLNPAWQNPRDDERAGIAELERERADAERAVRTALETSATPEERAGRASRYEADMRRIERHFEFGRDRLRARLKRERRARYWNWPREHLLLLAELLVTGPVASGVSLADFIGQNDSAPERQNRELPGTSGREVNFSPRFGIETEPVINLVKTRFGSYYEPNRIDDGRVGRQHFTFGADLRIVSTTWWGLVPEVIYKLQTSFDLAPRYESASFGMGVWH